jgi:hypothetical protein
MVGAGTEVGIDAERDVRVSVADEIFLESTSAKQSPIASPMRSPV